MKKLLSLLLVLTISASMLFGCAAKEETKEETTPTETSTEEVKATDAPAATEKPAELVELNVAYMPNFASLTSVVTGVNMGYFEEQGFKVNLVEFADGPTIIAAMESGSIDIGYIGPGAHKLCIQGRAIIFASSHFGSADEVIGNTDKGVNSIADLKGKTIAIASGTSSESILDLTLAEAGMTKDDVTVLDMDASAIVTAMISGSIDACATWSPNTFAIKEELGDKALMLSNSMMFMDKSPAIASWIVNPGYAAENADIILRYTKALYKAMDYRADEANIDQVVTWVAEQVALDYDNVYAQRADASWTTAEELVAMVNDGSLVAAYQTQQDNFIKSGAVTESVPVSDYVLLQNMLDAAK
ncbi:MAG: ABC transporter substrate-binding protein [Mobilitalea sp.]